jgi:hypothetical protein
MKRKFFFDHIYKAGGSSVELVFTHWLGKNNVTQGLVEPATSALLRYSDKSLVTGHFYFSPDQWFDPTRYALTMLRHPVDRIVSHYYFVRTDRGLRGGDIAVALAKELSFEDYVFSDVPEVRNQLENFQTRHYFPLAWDGSTDPSEIDQLEMAKQALLRYDLVGVFHEFEDFLNVLVCDIGLPPPEVIPRVNVTSKRPKVADLDPKLLMRLEKLNVLDIKLYEFAVDLFQRKRREVLRQCAVKLSSERAAWPANEKVLAGGSLSTDSPSPSVAKREPAEYGNRQIELLWATLKGRISLGADVFSGEVVCLTVAFRAHQPAEKVIIGFRITDSTGSTIFGINSKGLGQFISIRDCGDYFVDFLFRCDLGPGQYVVSAVLHPADDLTCRMYHWRDEITYFNVIGNDGYHWEGVTKLYPTLSCGSLLESSLPGLELCDAGEGWPRIQRIAVHTPALSVFSAFIRVLSEVSHLKQNEIVAIEVEVRNTSEQTWGSTGLRPVCISYHWFDEVGQMEVFDGERTPLPRDIYPNEIFRLWMTVKTVSKTGKFRLVITLVQEYVAWFDEQGCPPLEMVINIE